MLVQQIPKHEGFVFHMPGFREWTAFPLREGPRYCWLPNSIKLLVAFSRVSHLLVLILLPILSHIAAILLLWTFPCKLHVLSTLSLSLCSLVDFIGFHVPLDASIPGVAVSEYLDGLILLDSVILPTYRLWPFCSPIHSFLPEFLVHVFACLLCTLICQGLFTCEMLIPVIFWNLFLFLCLLGR